jgi:hypothetical protein
MITFVKVSDRRVMVLDVPTGPTGWTLAEGETRMGYEHAAPLLVTVAPVTMAKAREITSRYARERGKLVTHEAYEARRIK